MRALLLRLMGAGAVLACRRTTLAAGIVHVARRASHTACSAGNTSSSCMHMALHSLLSACKQIRAV